MQMKVLLMRANLPHVHQSLGIPLGILYLASSVRRALPGKCDIRILDPGKQQMGVDDIARYIQEWSPDVVGISGMTPEAPAIHQIAAAARGAAPSARILAGGPHVQAAADSVMLDENFDAACIGEGEETFPEMLEAFDAGESLEAVAGVAWRMEDGTVATTAPRPAIQGLDEMANPAWDLIDIPSYSRVRNMNGGLLAARPYMGLFTSRGCPYKCEYCHEVFGKSTRFRSAENVVDEMELLHREHGVNEFHIYDDIFNLDKKRAKKVCDLILDRGMRVKLAFPNALRGDIMDRELVEKLAAAGCYTTCLAVETASNRLQKLLKKNLKVDKVAESISQCADANILTIGYFMLGFPTETEEEIHSTVDFALKTRLHRASFFTVVPFPGSGLEQLVKQHYPEFEYDRKFGYFSTTSFYHWATGVDLGAIQRDAYRRFYLNPKRLWSLWRGYPSALSFIREASSAAYCMLPNLHGLREREQAPASTVPALLRRGV